MKEQIKSHEAKMQKTLDVLSKELEPKDISAKFENGILSLHLPKADAKKLEPKQTLIEIE